MYFGGDLGKIKITCSRYRVYVTAGAQGGLSLWILEFDMLA
jgi:hypothetical protein